MDGGCCEHRAPAVTSKALVASRGTGSVSLKDPEISPRSNEDRRNGHPGSRADNAPRPDPITFLQMVKQQEAADGCWHLRGPERTFPLLDLRGEKRSTLRPTALSGRRQHPSQGRSVGDAGIAHY